MGCRRWGGRAARTGGAGMVGGRRSVGLDVAARSILAGVLDSAAGQVWSRRLPAATEAVVSWVGSLPSPVGVAERLARPGSGWPGHSRRPGWAGWWWRRPSWNARPGVGSRPTGAMPNGWRGCPTLGGSLGCGCRPRPRGGGWSSGPSPPSRPCRSAGGPAAAVEAAAGPGLVWSAAAWTRRTPVAGQRRASGGPAWPGVAVAEADGRCWRARGASVSWPHAGLGAGGGPAGLAGWVAVLTSFGWRWRPATGSLHRGHGRAWLGLVAGEQSSGGRPSQGWITNTGNRHTRRLLVEAAWHHRNPIGPASSSGPATPASPRCGQRTRRPRHRRLQQRWRRLDARASAPPSAWSRSPASPPDGAGAWPSWRPDRAPQPAGGRHPPAPGATRDPL